MEERSIIQATKGGWSLSLTTYLKQLGKKPGDKVNVIFDGERIIIFVGDEVSARRPVGVEPELWHTFIHLIRGRYTDVKKGINEELSKALEFWVKNELIDKGMKVKIFGKRYLLKLEKRD